MRKDNINLGVSPQFYNPSKISEDNLDTSSKSILHQKSAACTVIFDTLGAKASFRLQAAIRPAFAPKVSKITVHAADF